MAGVDDRKNRVGKPGPHDLAPNERPRERGSRHGDADADSVLPGREFGAGGQIDDGPGVKGPPNTPRP